MKKVVETPYFLIHKDKLEEAIYDMHKAFRKKWDNYIIGYSYKTNSLPWIINFMKENNCFAEVVSTPEYKLALKIGYSHEKIILNGPNKGRSILIEALLKGSIVNLDNFSEIEIIKGLKSDKKMKVGLRVNYDLEKDCPGETIMGSKGGRFGFNYENGSLEKAINMLKTISNIEITGLHLHNNSKTRSLDIYRSICKKAVEIKQRFNLTLEYVNIGGGFFGGIKGKPSFYEYAEVISQELSKGYNSEESTLIIEPGAALIASPISFICEVVDVKDVFDKRIVTVNGSCNDINPFIRDKHFFIKLYAQSDFIIDEQTLVGFTCMEQDRITKLKRCKELKTGDLIEFQKVGAYTMALSPLFIEYFPAVIVKDMENYYYAREPWGIEEYCQKSYINYKEIK